MTLWLAATASAASLDLLEVGGAYGTPAATNPTATWWNPAGLAVHGGTQFFVEGAPVLASVIAHRDNPDYGAIENPTGATGFPTTYDYGGKEKFTYTGVVPFLGASSDFGVDGLGIGLALAVPSARGAKSTEAMGPNRYAVREGNIQAIHAMLGASYRLKELVALGASVSYVDSSWYADTDTSSYPDLAVFAQDHGSPAEAFQDPWIENPAYGSTLVLGGREPGGGHGALRGHGITFGGGVYLTPLGDALAISVAWNQGVKLTHDGDLTFRFSCPPEYDDAARAAAESGGLCDAEVPGTATVSYQLPSRLHLGVASRPIEKLRLELMGAWVGWHVFDDYAVKLLVNPADIDSPLGASGSGEVAALLSQDRKWARGAKDTFWVGLDGKYDLLEELTVGGRVTFDRSAIETKYVTANNLDADTLLLQAATQVRPSPKVGLGLSYTYALAGTRTVKNSAFSQDLARASADSPDYYVTNPAVNRTFYPSGNGTYALDIHRFGISVQGRFGGAGAL